MSAESSLVICVVAWQELRLGDRLSRRRVGPVATLAEFLTVVPIVAFTREDAESTAAIQADLARRGKTIGGNDAMIAGQARSRGWSVVTANVDEFSRVQGLEIENWRA